VQQEWSGSGGSRNGVVLGTAGVEWSRGQCSRSEAVPKKGQQKWIGIWGSRSGAVPGTASVEWSRGSRTVTVTGTADVKRSQGQGSRSRAVPGKGQQECSSPGARAAEAERSWGQGKVSCGCVASG